MTIAKIFKIKKAVAAKITTEDEGFLSSTRKMVDSVLSEHYVLPRKSGLRLALRR